MIGDYQAWRAAKLEALPSIPDLLVRLADPANPTPAERSALLERCRRFNMAVYCGPDRVLEKTELRALAARLGLVSLDPNQLADDDGISALAVKEHGPGARFIPYTNRPIAWHTDGYYNPPDRTVRGLILHCLRPAMRGGANALYDPDRLYIALRDRDPEWTAALERPDAFTIPAQAEPGLEPRPPQPSPVFSWDEDGHLTMRYTARTRSIAWNADPAVQRAKAALEAMLEAILAGDPPGRLEHRLEAGQGLICNNVLHTRTGFEDDPAKPRLIWRARYYERVGANGERKAL